MKNKNIEIVHEIDLNLYTLLQVLYLFEHVNLKKKVKKKLNDLCNTLSYECFGCDDYGEFDIVNFKAFYITSLLQGSKDKNGINNGNI